MNRAGAMLFLFGAGGCALFSCNAILGVEDEYRLVRCKVDDCEGAASGEGGQSGGTAGSSGSSTGGEGGAGDTGGTGTGGSAGKGGTGNGGTAGKGGTGGKGGSTGGTGPCVPSGAEECLNGVDDDCDGDIDCADSECAVPVQCVPVIGDGTPSTFL